jgi:uncharacterized protein involved in exopolysaccharide biosynthesis
MHNIGVGYNNDLNNEIDLLVIFRTILKYTKFILFSTFLITLFVFLISSIQPKVYEGYVIIRISQSAYTPNVTVLSGRELIEIIGNIESRKNEIFKKNKDIFLKAEIMEIKGTKDMLKIRVQSKDRDKISEILSELINYILNLREIKFTQERVQNELKMQLNEISRSLKESEDLMVLFKKNIREKPIAIGFDPVESNQHLNEMRLKKGLLEKESANYSYLRNAGEVQNTISPVKPRVLLNTILSFVITIIICVFFVFIIEYTKNEKNQNKEVHKCNAL